MDSENVTKRLLQCLPTAIIIESEWLISIFVRRGNAEKFSTTIILRKHFSHIRIVEQIDKGHYKHY